MKIEITCNVKDMMPMDQLKGFQGRLKDITSENILRLKTSILRYGFSFPVFIWKKNILDGHQRLEALSQLIEEGHEIKDNLVPIVKILAKNKKEAAEKLLLINSRYSTINQYGFDQFVLDFGIEDEAFFDTIDIPEITVFPQEEKPDYEGEWDGMPEYDNEDQRPVRTLLVHFNNEDDVVKFARLVEQKINEKTKFIYYPKLINLDQASMEYRAEE